MLNENSVLARACLQTAADLASQDEAEIENAPDFKPSRRFERKMAKLTKQVSGSRSNRKSKWAKVGLVAAILLIVTIVSGVAVYNENQPEKPYAITVYDKFTNVAHLDVRSIWYYDWFADYTFTADYMTEGFDLTNSQQLKYININTYENDEGEKIYISKSFGGGIAAINTQYYPYEEVYINDTWVIIYTSPDCGVPKYNALYYKDGMQYSVIGVLDKNELINIVTSLN